MLLPSWLSQPPPQVQAPNSGKKIAPQNRPQPTNAFHFHRSAIAPVGIVAVVSMTATTLRKTAAIGALYAAPLRPNPLLPNAKIHSPPTALPSSVSCDKGTLRPNSEKL